MEDTSFAVNDRRLLTPPNVLSLLRLALLPPTLLMLARQDSWGNAPALAALVLGMGSDALDGLLARRRGWVSDVGRMLDPLADKVYLGGVLIYLALERGLPVWLVAVVLARDAALMAATALLVRRHRVAFSANRWGKTATVLLTAVAFAYVLRLDALKPWLLALAGAAVAVSVIGYGLSARAYLRREPSTA